MLNQMGWFAGRLSGFCDDYTQNKTLLVTVKVPLDSGFALLLQTDTATCPLPPTEFTSRGYCCEDKMEEAEDEVASHFGPSLGIKAGYKYLDFKM